MKMRSPFGVKSRRTTGYPFYSDGKTPHGGEDYVPVDDKEENWRLYSPVEGSVYVSKKQKGDYAGGYGAYGNYIVILGDDGTGVLMAHLKALPYVKAGARVLAGQLIGVAGATGNVTGRHLHIEVTDMRGAVYDGATWYKVWQQRRLKPSDRIDFSKFIVDPKEEFEVVIYKNGSTPEPVYQTIADMKAKKSPIGSLDPREQCECYGKVDGGYLVVYTVNGTKTKKCGFVAYHGGVK